MKDMQHKAIAIYRSGLLLVTGHTPEGSLLFKRYMSASVYAPIAAPIISNPLLKYDNVFFFIVAYLPSIYVSLFRILHWSEKPAGGISSA